MPCCWDLGLWTLQVNVALDYMHLQGWGHCDVKPPNIFIDPQGDFNLGDYGAMRKLGEPANEQTARFVPSDAPFDIHECCIKLDKALLAVTVLERLGLLELKHGSGPSYKAIKEKVAGITHIELQSRLKALVP